MTPCPPADSSSPPAWCRPGAVVDDRSGTYTRPGVQVLTWPWVVNGRWFVAIEGASAVSLDALTFTGVHVR